MITGTNKYLFILFFNLKLNYLSIFFLMCDAQNK